jgi:hypothetical protein
MGLVKKSFSVHLSTMRVLGFYPTRNHNKLYKIYAYLVYCLLTVPVPTLAVVYLLTEENVTLTKVSDNAFLICQVGCFIAKFVPFWKNADKIRESLYKLENPIFRNYTKRQENIINESTRICVRNCWLNVILVSAALASWATTPFFRSMGKFRLPVEVWLPYDVTRNSTAFYFTYCYVVASKYKRIVKPKYSSSLGVGNGAIGSGVIDPLIAGLAYQATAQLKILKNSLQYLAEYVDEEIFHNSQNSVNCDYTNEESLRAKILYEKIKFCIKHHNAILE